MLAHVIYILSMTILALSVPHPTVSAVSGTLITVGLIGAWRYAWAGINLARAAYFLNFAYPRRQRLAAEALYRPRPEGPRLLPGHDLQDRPEISTRSTARSSKPPSGNWWATIVASIVDEAMRASFAGSWPRLPFIIPAAKPWSV